MITGQGIDRVDGALKVTGRAPFAAEFAPPGLVHAVLVTSSVPSGRIVRMDVAAATALPGVIAVLTPMNAPRLPQKGQAGVNPSAGRVLSLLQDDIVSYNNQPIAVAVADTLERAAQAARLVRVTYAAADAKLDFAAAEFAIENRRITSGALRALAGAFSDDLAELAAACQQLMADASEEITEVTVEKYYSGRVETNAFRVADVAIAGRRGDALILLRHALASGADPVPIVAAFASKLRTMAKISGAHGGSGQLAQQFGLAPWQVDRARRDLQGWDDRGLGRCIELLAETDAAIKGAGRDPVFVLERLVGVISTRGTS